MQDVLGNTGVAVPFVEVSGRVSRRLEEAPAAFIGGLNSRNFGKPEPTRTSAHPANGERTKTSPIGDSPPFGDHPGIQILSVHRTHCDRAVVYGVVVALLAVD